MSDHGSSWCCASWILLAYSLTANAAVPAEAPLFEEQALFESGADGYHTYRIPALCVTNEGTVLAFCEARKNSSRDHGDVDLALKRSADGGATWSKMEIIADDGDHTIGNACPVVDSKTGTIWLPLCRDNKRILMMNSTDGGRTWSKAIDLTEKVKPSGGHWFGAGPGHGIRLASGRLLVPCWADATAKLGEAQFSYVFYSDDAGATWKVGGALDRDASDECEVVELSDGTVYMNARSRQGKRQRAYAISRDGGETWSAVEFDPKLPEPSCQGSLVRFTDAKRQDKNRVLLAAPADPSSRTRMTVRLSYDECRTWPVAKVVRAGSAGYSDLAVNRQTQALLLYESDDYSKLTLARFDLEWLTGGKDRVRPGR